MKGNRLDKCYKKQDLRRGILSLKSFLLVWGVVIFSCQKLFSQSPEQRSVSYYVEEAKRNSPLIKDYTNQSKISDFESQRLKAIYTQFKLELNGSLLFVPLVAADNGVTLGINNRGYSNYYGYDQSVSSSAIQAGVTVSKPLFYQSAYKNLQEQYSLSKDINVNNIKLQEHDLERLVRDQYILCLLDKEKIAFTDSLLRIVQRQAAVVMRLSKVAILKQTDNQLLEIEKFGYLENKKSYLQSYYSHLIDLNVVCGIRDTSNVELADLDLNLKMGADEERSNFLEKYRLDSLNVNVRQNIFENNYRPQVNFFVDGGLRDGSFDVRTFKHFGVSAGLTFTWLLYDGKQRDLMRNESKAQINSVSLYRENFMIQNDLKKKQYLSELKSYEDRKNILQKEIAGYDRVLSNYEREIQMGQLSVIDYITVLKNKTLAMDNYYTLTANRLLLINAFNYYNW